MLSLCGWCTLRLLEVVYRMITVFKSKATLIVKRLSSVLAGPTGQIIQSAFPLSFNPPPATNLGGAAPHSTVRS